MPDTLKQKLQDATVEILEEIGVFKRGHFVYTSGKHGEFYVAKTDLLPNVVQVHDILELLAKRVKDLNVDVVVGPAMGAITLAHAMAFELSTIARPVLAVRADKKNDDAFQFPYDWAELLDDKRVLIVEDVLTTGKSARFVVDAVLNAGGMPVGTAALYNRGGLSAEDVASPVLIAAVDKRLPDYPGDDCPLCAQDVPINTDFGHGAAFMAALEG